MGRASKTGRSGNDAGKAAGRARLKACKLCSASFYVAMSSIVVFFLFFGLFGAIGGLVAVVMGVSGRLALGRLGRTDALRNKESSPIERVAARMEPRARREGMLGPIIGGCLAAYWLLIFFAAATQTL